MSSAGIPVSSASIHVSSAGIPVSFTGIPVSSASSSSGHCPASGRSTSHRLDTVVGNWDRDEPCGTHFAYSKVPGPTSAVVDSSSSAYDLFSRFFTEELWSLLVTETIAMLSRAGVSHLMLTHGKKAQYQS